MRELVVGDPLDPDTNVGPLINGTQQMNSLGLLAVLLHRDRNR